MPLSESKSRAAALLPSYQVHLQVPSRDAWWNVGVPVPREPFSFGGMYGTARSSAIWISLAGEFAIAMRTSESWAHEDRGTSRITQPSHSLRDFAHSQRRYGFLRP